ncbi:hypothetical protein GCM10025854_26990 [Tetragenococcus muriaticus]|nr:hypothetical protein GCM10025854_03940 [Tetragenococcus muriaticus]GMA48449.1 hypothetical protein GCM10025854_26990 [Tetragenococcus muriaticus]
MKQYTKFLLMILVSTVIMYGLMYLNVFQLDHIFLSQTRLYMALIMGATMAIVMLLFMWSMYQNKRLNRLILLGSAVIFAGSLYLVRSQATQRSTAGSRGLQNRYQLEVVGLSHRPEIG